MTSRLLTPTKITAFLDCAHSLALERRRDAGEQFVTAGGGGEMADMLRQKGLDHEQACLDHYRARGLRVLAIGDRHERERFDQWAARIAAQDPFGGDHDVIFQMPFVHDDMRGVADFLLRVERDGVTTWEPLDAKLARTAAKPGHILQLCFYADAIAAATGHAPEHLHIWLGSGEIELVRLDDVHAYWRRLRAQLDRAMGEPASGGDTEPEPCSHCDFCDFAPTCEAQWRGEDSLVHVAGLHKADRHALVAHGTPTIADLADLAGVVGAGVAAATGGAEPALPEVDGVRPERLERLTLQAALQVAARDRPDALPPIRELPVVAEPVPLGYAALPCPDHGDVFLDYEGHPFWRAERGLFFLFGLLLRDETGAWVYDARWAHDLDGEAAITAGLIDDLADRRRRHPGMHVYHYNHTERSALQSLAATHGVRETLLTELVDSGLFVDLFPVVTGAMQVGSESYGLKHIELHSGYQRSHDIDAGSGAVVDYDRWCTDADSARLERIARYNADDVEATKALRDWLVARRPPELPWRAPVFEVPEPADVDLDARVEALLAIVPAPAAASADGAEPADTPACPEHLLAHLLGYWRRETHAVFTELVVKTGYELPAQLDDPSVIAGLECLGTVERIGAKGQALDSPAIVLRFPTQTLDRDLAAGKGQVVFARPDGLLGFASIDGVDLDPVGGTDADPDTDPLAGTTGEVLPVASQQVCSGEVRLVWNDACDEAGAFPAAVVLNDSVGSHPKPEALTALADDVLDPARTPNPAAMALLRAEAPRMRAGAGPAPGAGGFSDDVDDMRRWIDQLDDSAVAIQGPPGTGKTYTGSHLTHELLRAGRRVGICAMSHAAVDNLLDATIEVLRDAGDLEGLQIARRAGSKRPELPATVTHAGNAKAGAHAKYDLVTGTAWHFANKAMRETPVDVLFIDEAGQLGLADAMAATMGAHNVVLLGDPLQLPQVVKGTHPAGAGASVLTHVLDGAPTITADRGVFLGTTRRMHPDVCGFISDHIYEGRLTSHPDCARQDTEHGTGLRWIPARHQGRSTSSPEEAAIVADMAAELVGRQWTDAAGRTGPIPPADVLVVAPYNDQVATIRAALDANPVTAAVRVGSVDKFQGQEGAAVIFSMTASTAADVPRGLDFLFSKNRLNVAVSRARCLAYLVCTEELLDSRARSVKEMELISTLCSFVERATRRPAG